MAVVTLPRGHRSRVPVAIPGAAVATIESRVLRDNPLGDPYERRVGVYVPPSGVTEGRPLLVLLAGFSGEGSHLAERPSYLGEGEIAWFDRLVRTGEVPEATVVAPDCLTTLGGSQYVNSAATGRYEDFVMDELLPWAREKFRPSAVGVLGQSSGGFGALHLALSHPGVFGAVGSSAGDLAFDLTLRPSLARAARGLRDAGGPEEFVRRLLNGEPVVRGPTDPSGEALIVLALAACYSPRADARGGFELPFDPETAEIDLPVWQRWLAFDPCVRTADTGQRDRVRALRGLYLTASVHDEWFLDFGARRFCRQLRALQVPVRYDEFPGAHFDKRPRFEALYRTLVRTLADGSAGERGAT